MNDNIKLTTRGRYAVMAMVELAKSEDGSPVPLSEIAQRGQISLSYLEQLVAGLRRQSLVKSYRGPGGGYILARPIAMITVSEILQAAEDSTPAKRNARKDEEKAAQCLCTQALWSHIGSLLHASLRHISLEDVLNHGLHEHPHSRKVFELL